MTRVPRAQPQTTSYILTTSESVPCLSSGYYLCLCAGSSTSQTMNGVRVTGSDLHDQLRTLFRLRLGPGHAGGARTFTCGCCGKTLTRASDATHVPRTSPWQFPTPTQRVVRTFSMPGALISLAQCAGEPRRCGEAASGALHTAWGGLGSDWCVHTADATSIWSDQIDIELAL